MLTYGKRAMKKLLADYKFTSVADVGCGDGEAYQKFVLAGKAAIAIDIVRRFPQVIEGDYLSLELPQQDCIWTCHALEHQFNPHRFLQKIYEDLRPAGIIAVTVPPYEDKLPSGHISYWNAGMLLYHLVLAGFDCREAAIRTYGYNVSVIVQKNDRRPPLLCDRPAEIRALSPYLPKPYSKPWFNGQIAKWNWRGA